MLIITIFVETRKNKEQSEIFFENYNSQRNKKKKKIVLNAAFQLVNNH